MTLQNQFERELLNLGDGGPATVAVNDSPRQLSCDVVERNSLAVSFNQLLTERPMSLASADAAALERIGKRHSLVEAHVSHGAECAA